MSADDCLTVVSMAPPPTATSTTAVKDDEVLWLVSLAGNLMFGLAILCPAWFVDSLSTEVGMCVQRVLFMLGHLVASYVAVARWCDARWAAWTSLFLLVNLIRLVQNCYKNWPSRLPTYLQSAYRQIFQPFNISIQHFNNMIGRCSKLAGIGEGDMLPTTHDNELCILLTGRVTAWCEGVPLHSITPDQLLNSFEWHMANNSSQHGSVADVAAAAGRRHIDLIADQDSTYLRIDTLSLDRSLLHILKAIVGKDMTLKMYAMNETFERDSKTMSMRRSRSRFRNDPLIRSLSSDVIKVSSKGNVVTRNWLVADPLRFRMLACDKAGAPRNASRRSRSLQGSHASHGILSSDLAYVMSQTHKSLKRQNEDDSVVPSLLQQAIFLDKLEGCCRFVDPDLVHEAWNGDQAWDHCGTCLFCRPLGEGEPQQTVTSVSIKV